MRTFTVARWVLVLTASSMLALSVAGCRVSETDVQRWESTEHGPEKLVAVITHDKYDNSLRTQAAMALVRMKPRSGRRVGITKMVDALASLPSSVRPAIIAGIVPILISQMASPAPVPQPGQPVPPDGSIAFKDAAYALLSHEPKGSMITDTDLANKLSGALVQWVAADFEHRYDNPQQMFGVEQVVRFLGPPAAKPLPALITPDARKVTELAKLIAENGDAASKEEASKKLVDVAQFTASQKWLDQLKPILEEANRSAKLAPTPAQFAMQMTAAQDEALERLFGALRKVGGRAAVEFCLTFAANTKESEQRRMRAIAGVEGNFDQKNPNDVQRILALAGADDTPDKVRDLAFARVGEMPRDKVIGKLYEMFGNKRWQVRWVAAQLVIKMSDTSQIPEILNRLPQTNFAMTEALTYGDWIGNSKIMAEKDGKTARSQVLALIKDSNVAARTSALSFFYTHGVKTDLPILSEQLADRAPIGKCDDKQKDCEWKCMVPKENDPRDKESKDIGNVGDFVKYCVIPALKQAK